MSGIERLRTATVKELSGDVLIRGMTERAGARFAFLSDGRFATCLRTDEEVPDDFVNISEGRRGGIEPSLRKWISAAAEKSRPVSPSDLAEWAGRDIYRPCESCDGDPLRCGWCEGKGARECACDCGEVSHKESCQGCGGRSDYRAKKPCPECGGLGREIGCAYIRWDGHAFNGNILALALSFCEPEAGTVSMVPTEKRAGRNGGPALRVEAHDARWIVMLMPMEDDAGLEIVRELAKVSP